MILILIIFEIGYFKIGIQLFKWLNLILKKGFSLLSVRRYRRGEAVEEGDILNITLNNTNSNN